MEHFMNELELIYNIPDLFSFKEHIKNEVKNPQLNWESRMYLYQKVQLINERIQFLQST